MSFHMEYAYTAMILLYVRVIFLFSRAYFSRCGQITVFVVCKMDWTEQTKV